MSKTKSMSLLNQSGTKRFILAQFRSLRPGMPITLVSQQALDVLEAELRCRIIREVRRHPSIGKTFKMPLI